MSGSEPIEYVGHGRGFLGFWKPQDKMEQRNVSSRRAGLPFLAIVFIVQLVRAIRDGWTAEIAIPITIVVVLAAMGYAAQSCRVRITATTVQLRYFGVTRKLQRSDIVQIADVIVTESSQYSSTENRYLLLLNNEGHSIGKVSQLSFSVDVLREVINRLQRPVKSLHSPQSPKDLREIYPHSFSWFRCHPIWSGLLLTPVVLVAVGAIVAIASLFA